MISAMFDGKGRGELALCTCDTCAAEVVIPAAHADATPTSRARKVAPEIRSPGQCHTRLQGMGWSIVKGRLRCPACTKKRQDTAKPPGWLKAAINEHEKEGQDMGEAKTVDGLRRPNQAQRREIHQHLLSFYDTLAGRYQDAATDKTIADMIGGGCLPGWVAEIREADYGPNGGNAEIEEIEAEIEAIRAFLTDRLDALHKRLDALKAAVGPRAARA